MRIQNGFWLSNEIFLAKKTGTISSTKETNAYVLSNAIMTYLVKFIHLESIEHTGHSYK